MRNIHLLCFIRYNLRYFGRVGNMIVVYSSIVIDSPDLLVFPLWWSLKFLPLYILCNKWSFSDTPPGILFGVPSLFHIHNGFTVKHRRSVRMLCQCGTNCAGNFTLDAHAPRPVACVMLILRKVTPMIVSMSSGDPVTLTFDIPSWTVFDLEIFPR